MPESILQDGTLGGSLLLQDWDFSNTACSSNQDRIICLLEAVRALTSRTLDKEGKIMEEKAVGKKL